MCPPNEAGVTCGLVADYLADAVSHWDEVYKTWRVEPGEWQVKVGKDAQTFVAAEKFVVEHDIEWTGL